MLPYDKANVPLAKTLRKQMTPWEIKLWAGFLRQHEFRWQRQKPILSYIVDFYCAKAGLIIELDGGGHYTDAAKSKDAARTKELSALGLEVLRFGNNDVDTRFPEVCQVIDDAVRKRI